MTAQNLKHATFVFERICAAPVERVFAAFTDPVERTKWGTPSETATFIYDKTDFREGGQDVFRCGNKDNPQYRGTTTYLDIVPNRRIVSTETVETQGAKLMVSLSTTVFEREGAGAKLTVTVQVASFAGDDMINGTKFGHNASLDNLVEAMRKAA